MKFLPFALLTLCLIATGCQSEPALTSVSGKITKNGKPMNMVEVRFVPVDETLNKYMASGISDEEGNFTIGIPGREEALCCVGQCKVTLREAPVPGDIRGRLERNEGGEGGNALMKYKASLKGRPIPRGYEVLHSTPLLFDVTTDKSEYNIELK